MGGTIECLVQGIPVQVSDTNTKGWRDRRACFIKIRVGPLGLKVYPTANLGLRYGELLRVDSVDGSGLVVSTSAHLGCNDKFLGTSRAVEELVSNIRIIEFGQGHAELLLLILRLAQGGVVA